MTGFVEQENFTNLTFVGDDLIFAAETVSSLKSHFLFNIWSMLGSLSFLIDWSGSSSGYWQRIFRYKRRKWYISLIRPPCPDKT